MTNEIRNPNVEGPIGSALSDFVLRHCFGFRPSSFVICHLALWFGVAASVSLASPSSPRFTVDPPWTTQKGLPESSVFSLLQTRDGYLWIGTGYGLARFDGIHFNTFDETDAPGLSSGKIVSLFEDSRGNLWVGTETEGIMIVDRQGKVSRLIQAGTGEAGRLVTICEDPSGAIWL